MRRLFYLYSLMRGILLLMVAVAFVHLYLGSVFIVSGLSMSPNLQDKDIVWVNKLAYLSAKPERGDMVVLKYPGDPDNRKFVKRIIGLPKEEINIKNGEVFVDNERLTEAYLGQEVVTQPDMRVSLQPDEYFAMGDSRANSSDSRVFGATSRRFLIGRAKLRLWPLSRAGYFAPVFY